MRQMGVCDKAAGDCAVNSGPFVSPLFPSTQGRSPLPAIKLHPALPEDSFSQKHLPSGTLLPRAASFPTHDTYLKPKKRSHVGPGETERVSGKSRRKTTEWVRRLSFVRARKGGIHQGRRDRTTREQQWAGRPPPRSARAASQIPQRTLLTTA